MENLENENIENQSSINLEKKETDFQSRIDMIELRASLDKVKSEIGKVIVGQFTVSYTWNNTKDNTSYNGNVANSATLNLMVAEFATFPLYEVLSLVLFQV